MTLTRREVEFLQAVSLGRPGKDVARELGISVGTLKNHISSILAKTRTSTQVQAINMARHARLIGELGPPVTPPEPRRS